MPTTHVRPDSVTVLQEIADALWKAKKVIVVTGAGISTNSGIPDFRSENGLYSLIQAQFDAACKEPTSESAPETDCDASQGAITERPPKRRKISASPGDVSDINLPPAEDQKSVNDNASGQKSEDEAQTVDLGAQTHSSPTVMVSPSDDIVHVKDEPLPLRPEPLPGPGHSFPAGQDLSSPPNSLSSEDSLKDSLLPSHHALPLTSSPLSSPPPVLFNPYERSSRDSSPSQNCFQSSSASSETDDTSPSQTPLFASQSSVSSRNSLPNMKGRELFDASIWADPMKTSVFYTFATTLRKKVKEVRPTSSHRFIGQLRDTGKLVRCYTQNIDEIEQKVGLSTSLVLGPGSKGRFSNRALKSAPPISTTKMPDSIKPEADEAGATRDHPDQDMNILPSERHDEGVHQSAVSPESGSRPARSRDRGVECVFLHGSLNALRCFLCGRVCNWDEDGREHETLSGRQPSCPHCQGATAAREERGKRALGVGKLRPDIVLYGEEHPSAHLISPIVQHDLSLAPDMLLILGTSLRVHGLKVMVKEFAKAVHNKGGKVVFVNFTKPPDSVWSDIIDYWIQWDCDAWVQDLKDKKPILWLSPQEVAEAEAASKAAKLLRRESSGLKKETPGDGKSRRASEGARKPEAKRPMATRDHKANGAFLIWKIRQDLTRITGSAIPTPSGKVPRKANVRKKRQSAPAAPQRLESTSVGQTIMPLKAEVKTPKSRAKRPSKKTESAALRDRLPKGWVYDDQVACQGEKRLSPSEHSALVLDESSSILSAVKSNPRKRQRKTIFEGALVSCAGASNPSKTTPKTTPPSLLKQRAVALPLPVRTPLPLSRSSGVFHSPPTPAEAFESRSENHLPPLRTPYPSIADARDSFLPPDMAPRQSRIKPMPLEPSPTAMGPLTSISPNSPRRSHMLDPFYLYDALETYLTKPPLWPRLDSSSPSKQLRDETAAARLREQREAAVTLSRLGGLGPELTEAP